VSDVTGRLTSDRITIVRVGVLAFFDAHRREMPWRSSADPYRVWVSEVMLQQTRVETVLPYYERWIRRFPTLEHLADADIDDVLVEWQGLGYYSRARNLHRAAREVRERLNGRIPGEHDGLLRLPGIGRYTAGAIASIAFGHAVPAVDGNVRRVLHRLLDAGDIAQSTLEAVAARLVPRDRPGDFNQGLMELGSTVCTPRSPSCGFCPVSAACEARKNGTQAIRPAPKKSAAVPEFDVGTAVVRDGGRLLLVRRPEKGLLAGMWEFPGAIVRPSETARGAARRAARTAGAKPARAARLLAAVPHAFSHRRETYHAWLFETDRSGDTATGNGNGAKRIGGRAGVRWVREADLDGLALPAAQRRIARLAVRDALHGEAEAKAKAEVRAGHGRVH
jgi:A/G-specific adenine glycosylase